MLTRQLGTTGIVTSEIGFGAWGIGGWTTGQLSYGATDDATSLAALERALAIGYTLVDTAPLYGLGHSEELVGRAIRGRRDRVVLATKAGYRSYGDAADYSPDAVERSLAASLRRLGTDHVDVLQLHSPPMDLLRRRPEIVGGLVRLQERGLIRTFGLSAASPAEAAAAIREFGFPVVQVNFNMLDVRCVTDGVFAAARECGTGLVARTPLCFGFLTGTIAADTVFPAEDHRSRWNGPQVARWVKGADDVLALAGARRRGDEVETALRFPLAFPEVAAIIPGILTPAEAEANARASSAGPLAADLVEQVVAYNRTSSPFSR